MIAKESSVKYSLFGFVILLAGFLCSLLLTGCNPNSCDLEPPIVYFPQQRFLKCLPACFPPLKEDELRTDWGKEIKIGDTFTKELDLYRGITSYKRALVLMPKREVQRRLQVNYEVMFAYYLGGKYRDALDTFEDTDLANVPDTFPAFRNIMIMLYDIYYKLEEFDKACKILNLIENYDADLAKDLRLSNVMIEADFEQLDILMEDDPRKENFDKWLTCYCSEAKSVRKAQTLNAILPGAGYYYVGQKKSALTSFLINAAFIAATYQFADSGYPAAAIIMGSLEMGWYLGGINGAGLEAKAYNESRYTDYTKEMMVQNRLFPMLMFQCAF